jgi:membrane-bound serine protease (ClpP class)
VESRSIRILLFLVLLLLVGQQLIQTHKAAAVPTYYVASLNGTIDPGAEDFVVSSINNARASGADHFILILNTLGGAGDNMVNIITAISAYESEGNNFTTLIAPSSGHAFSAGAFIAEASTNITMVAGTVIGSATPIITGIPDAELASIQQKDIAAFATYMETLTLQFHRNATAAGEMVTLGRSYDNVNATRKHVVDRWLPVTSVLDALTMMGVPAETPIQTPSWRSQAISILSDPNLDALLFLIGAFAILLDLLHPTLIVSIVGGAALVLALFGFGLFGASLTSIILMLIGAAFIFLELKTHHGISALAGVVIFVIGFLLIFQTPPLPAQPSPSTPPLANFFQISPITYAIIGAIAALGIGMSLYLYGLREEFQKHVPHFDPKGIIGKEGKLLTDLKAGGVATANIGAEEWSVTASEDIAKGTRVKVLEVEGLKLKVQKMDG